MYPGMHLFDATQAYLYAFAASRGFAPSSAIRHLTAASPRIRTFQAICIFNFCQSFCKICRNFDSKIGNMCHFFKFYYITYKNNQKGGKMKQIISHKLSHIF